MCAQSRERLLQAIDRATANQCSHGTESDGENENERSDCENGSDDESVSEGSESESESDVSLPDR